MAQTGQHAPPFKQCVSVGQQLLSVLQVCGHHISLCLWWPASSSSNMIECVGAQVEALHYMLTLVLRKMTLSCLLGGELFLAVFDLFCHGCLQAEQHACLDCQQVLLWAKLLMSLGAGKLQTHYILAARWPVRHAAWLALQCDQAHTTSCTDSQLTTASLVRACMC